MRRCPRRGGRYRACQLASHFLFVCYLVWFTRGVKNWDLLLRVVFAFWKVEE